MSTHKSYLDSPHIPLPNGIRESLFANGRHGNRGRSATPIGRNIPSNTAHLMSTIEGDLGAEEDPRLAVFRDLYNKSEARLNQLLGEEEEDEKSDAHESANEPDNQNNVEAGEEVAPAAPKAQTKPSRNINEDDYDESDEDDDPESTNVSPLKFKSAVPSVALPPSTPPIPRMSSSNATPNGIKGSTSSIAGKTTEEARKKLEEDKKAREESAKRNFHTLFYTLENDRDAMLEQEKIEESEHQADVEMGGSGLNGSNGHGFSGGGPQQGTLSQANLGASSLALKNLIQAIDGNRGRVSATDQELRALFGEVRKGRSKWASDERVGQEELYESAETVLNLLRAKSEHASVFLTRVNKKEAPDYGNSKCTLLSV